MRAKLLPAALIFGAACMAASPASACVTVPIFTVDVPGPPAQFLFPEEIAAREQEREREREAEQVRDALRKAQALDAHWLQLATEADLAGERLVSDLAGDLVRTMVPPVLPQWVPRSDCGYDWARIITANSGYIQGESAYYSAMGIPQPADRDGRRTRDNFYTHQMVSEQCAREARALSIDTIVAEFSKEEIVRVWGGIHRLGYNRGGERRGWLGGLLPRRLLEFSGGTNGLLRLAAESPVNGWSFNYPLEGDGYSATINSIVEGEKMPENWAALTDFLSHDPVAARMVSALSDVLQDGTPAQCPHASAEMERIAALLTLPEEEQARLYWEEARRNRAAD